MNSDMKKYIDAELQIVRMNNRDIVTESLHINSTDDPTSTWGNAADRFRDFEDYSY